MKPCQTLQRESTQEKGEKKETRGQGPKSKQAIHPKEAKPQRDKEGITKYQNFHQSLA